MRGLLVALALTIVVAPRWVALGPRWVLERHEQDNAMAIEPDRYFDDGMKIHDPYEVNSSGEKQHDHKS